MASQKGSTLEELVRAFFSQQGYFCLRGARYTFEGQDVTDIDVWLYGKQGASVRTRGIVDVKNKKTPKALERILWVKGMQAALKCDRAIVATTDTDPRVARFARRQGVAILSKSFIGRLEKGVSTIGRLSEEDFVENIKMYSSVKQDGDWLGILQSIKSTLITEHGFSAFNHAMVAFKNFAIKAKTRPQNLEQAVRCAFYSASIACIALDSALSFTVYDDMDSRYASIINGVTYGDDGNARVKSSISSVLEVISTHMENGKSISAQAKGALDSAFASVRSEIVADFFSRDQSGINLFRVAKSLEERSHSKLFGEFLELSIDEKTILGVFCDFVQVPRSNLFSISASVAHNVPTESEDSFSGESDADAHQPQSKLL